MKTHQFGLTKNLKSGKNLKTGIPDFAAFTYR